MGSFGSQVERVGHQGENRDIVERWRHNELQDMRTIRVVEDGNKGNPSQGKSFAEAVKSERSQSLNTIWIEVGESLSRDEMGTLKFCLVGR